MPQHYDNIIRENIVELLFGLAKYMLGKDIQASEQLNLSLRKTLAREPDFLQVVEIGGKKLILHIEFQTTDDADICYREAIYNILIRMQEGEELALEQHIFYLGEKDPKKMKEGKTRNSLIPPYTVHHFREFPYTDFLHSSSPEMVVFTILCNFLGNNPEEIITQILKRLAYLCTEELAYGKYLNQLEILAKIRNLQEQVIEIQKTMPFTYNLQEDIRFKQGIKLGEKRGFKLGEKRGIKLGEKRGIELGEKRGEVKEQRMRIKKMLANGFSPEQIIEGAGYEEKLVLEIQKSMTKK